MTGRLTKLRRRRDAAPATAGAPSGPVGAASTGSGPEQPTAVMPAAHAPLFADPAPAVAPEGPPLPADVAPGTQAAPGFRDRGAYRRRLRYLRRVRELGFRDLGGLVFDLHRFGRTGDEIVHAKLVALDAVDRELRALERVLRDEHAFTDLREPGVSACARCGALHGSDARFCPSCGVSIGGPTALGVPAAPSSGPEDTAQPVAIAAPIMPLAQPEPEPPIEASPPAAVDAKATVDAEAPLAAEAPADTGPPVDAAAPVAAQAPVDSEQPVDAEHPDDAEAPGDAEDRPSTPVTAAALGLPVPTPPPVPPLPPVDTDDSAR